MKIRINDVILSYPVLFEPKAFKAEDTPAYSAAFLMEPDHEDVANVKKAMQAAAKEKWGEKAPTILKSLVAGGRICLRSGDEKSDSAGYEGKVFIASRNAIRPTVLDRDKSPLTAADGKIYAGCRVNAVLDIWAMDNKWGKRICASLLGVQFFEDGERLAGGDRASEDDFMEIPDDGEGGGDLFGDEAIADGIPF